jgi:hypothetical protein
MTQETSELLPSGQGSNVPSIRVAQTSIDEITLLKPRKIDECSRKFPTVLWHWPESGL